MKPSIYTPPIFLYHRLLHLHKTLKEQEQKLIKGHNKNSKLKQYIKSLKKEIIYAESIFKSLKGPEIKKLYVKYKLLGY